jgi:5-methylcytosine-specific restriction endonuclease McrA
LFPKPQKKPRKKRKQQNSKGEYGKRIPDYRRREVVERDQGICQYCGRFTNLEGIGIHHIIYRSHANRDRVHDLCNLITLCCDCHRKIHDQGNREIKQFTIDFSVQRYGTEGLEMVLKPKKGVGRLVPCGNH